MVGVGKAVGVGVGNCVMVGVGNGVGVGVAVGDAVDVGTGVVTGVSVGSDTTTGISVGAGLVTSGAFVPPPTAMTTAIATAPMTKATPAMIAGRGNRFRKLGTLRICLRATSPSLAMKNCSRPGLPHGH